jgi:mono/diheme cytochrome c family protein
MPEPGTPTEDACSSADRARLLAHATLAAALLMAGSLSSALAAAETPPSERDARLEHGRYMLAAADCAACHTDPRTGAAFAGGRPIQTPFGVVVASNITPDKDTGIGNWTDREFEAAVREGKRPDGSRLYPAMPFPYYRKMTREDVLAIRAFLATVPAVRHAVESNRLPFPFDIRAGLRLWDAIYFSDQPFTADTRRSAEWNRGAYLVQGAGHCAACHTPKTLLGGDRSGQHFEGYSIQGWFAPDITDDKALGLGGWSVDDIVAFLKSGHNRIAAAAGPMGEVVSDSTSLMNDTDLRAIATYLKSDQRTSAAGRPPAADAPMRAGGAIYQDLCSACHQHDGTGVPYLIPNLASSSSVASRETTTLLRVLLHGAQSVATDSEPTGASMPAFGRELTDEQIAAVATYVRNSWGHTATEVSREDVAGARKASAP